MNTSCFCFIILILPKDKYLHSEVVTSIIWSLLVITMFKFSKDWILIHWRHVQTTWLVARKWSRCHWNKSVWFVKVFKLCEVNVSWHSILNCIVHEGSCWPRKCNRLSNRFLLPVILNSLIIQTGSSFMTRGNWRKEIFRMLKRRILDDLL